MELRTLRIFATIAECGSVTAAAQRLNTVQSNVTARLKDLERELGTPLFHRTGRGMRATPAGEILLPYAARIDRLAEEARQAVAEAAGDGGLLRLGALETTTAVRLPAVLKRLHDRFPRVDLAIQAGPTEELVQALLDYRIEAALVGGQIEHPALTGTPVYRERLVLVRGRGAAPGETGTNEPVIIGFRAGCSYRARLERWLRESGRLPFRVLELGTLDGILGCVAAGLGATALPEATVANSRHADALTVEALPEEMAEVPTYLLQRRDVPTSRALAAFLDCLHEPALAGRAAQ